MNRPYVVCLDREGAEWLIEEARAMFARTRDYGWSDLADDLTCQLPAVKNSAEGDTP